MSTANQRSSIKQFPWNVDNAMGAEREPASPRETTLITVELTFDKCRFVSTLFAFRATRFRSNFEVKSGICFPLNESRGRRKFEVRLSID